MILSKIAIREHRALKSRWSDESRLSQQVLIAVLWRLEQQNELLTKLIRQKKTKKPLTKYQRFFGKQIKKGLTAKETAKLWQEKQTQL